MAGVLDDGKASISSRTLYFENDAREQDTDQRQTVTGLKADFVSGYTPGVVGLGFDLQAVAGFNLGGGIDNPNASTVNTVSPVDTDGTPVKNWSSLRGNVKATLSRSEVKAGNALAPNLPILVANDGRLLPASYQGITVSSKDLSNATWVAGRLNREIGRASSNWGSIGMSGGSKGANGFTFAGVDYTLAPNLTVQYYYSQLDDYYRQNFGGLMHAYKISPDQSIKIDLRYFSSSSVGKNGEPGYRFNNNNGYATDVGEVKNHTWSAAFTYAVGGNSFLLGHQRVSDEGGMASINNGSLRDGRGRPEGEGGATYYLYTDSMLNAFVRAGENTTFGQYAYAFAGMGIPGLKASVSYLHGTDIRDAQGASSRYSEWERDMRVDYVIQSGPAKGLAFTLRRGSFRTEVPDSQGGYDFDQTRFLINYTYSFN
ncbi:OprD family outer membrane porin [Pseudomonas monteilii]